MRPHEGAELLVASMDEELAATLRLLMSDPIVWPEFTGDDAVYVYNLGVRRRWAGHDLGGRLLDWAEGRAAGLGRRFVRLDCRRDNGLEQLCRYEKAVHV